MSATNFGSSFRRINNLLGWLVFTIASTVYLLTIEPTASFWDCGEYIATAFKLQVGHPPGAPLFQMIGRFFSLFAFGDTSHVAATINAMSALSSGFTILFLFWTLSLLGRKLAMKNGEWSQSKIIAVWGSAAVGSLAYTFSDSFWFSAVEGEVYAMSSFFTALVFWAILKWDEAADEPHASRWLIFIAYLIGLSIGVHLLNLLAIPAIAFVFYFKKYNPTKKGIVLTLFSSILLLGFIMSGLIPWVVRFAGYFELLFINVFRLPFNSGTVIYFLVLIGGLYWAITFTRKKQKVVWNTVAWAFTFILIGYSSFFLLIIRSNANTPIDENNPQDAISLLSYLNREQYGDWPILYGPYFNTPVIGRKDGKAVYRKNMETGKYIIADDKKNTEPVYDPEFETIFPRMWNNTEKRYIEDYKAWSDFKGIPIKSRDESGETTTIKKPTFGENLSFFFRYQINHMYIRYFMWNFAGKQNDIQGRLDQTNGNWISGIGFLDKARLGPVMNPPESLRSKAMNRFFMLPFILGLLGFIYQWRKDSKNVWVVSLLFLMTGLAILVYLNQNSPQPRERDYAYAASFYAFAIWIGFGVYALFDFIRRKINPVISAWIATGLALVLVPGIMAQQGWDDHDRSDRYTALALANDYLNSCAPNAILFTNGDNDTFPLWYAQEVEGIRTDIRVVNLSLLNTEWYIEQMKRQAYDSDPVPFSLGLKHYHDGERNYTYFVKNDQLKGPVELSKLIDIVRENPEKLVMDTRIGPIDFFPTQDFKITIDSAEVVNSGTVNIEDAGKIVDEVVWKIPGGGVGKNNLMVLDLIANNHWKRPIYFSSTTGNSSYIGLEDYFQLEGLTFRFVPIKTNRNDPQTGRVNTREMFTNLMEKYQFGNINSPDVYLDETNRRMIMNLRGNYSRLADALVDKKEFDRAEQVMDRCIEMMPDTAVPYDYFMLPIAEGYYRIGNNEKGDAIFSRVTKYMEDELMYYFGFTGKQSGNYSSNIRQNLSLLQNIIQVSKLQDRKEMEESATKIFEFYYKLYKSKK